MATRLEACYFDSGGGDGTWPRLARVLEHSARAHCQGWEIRITPVAPVAVATPFGSPSHRANTQKLTEWTRRVLEAQDGDRVVLMDADMLIVRSMDAIWEVPFDLAYATRDWRIPFNAGAIWLTVSPVTKRFLVTWLEENRRLLQDPKGLWKTQWGGVNQAALANILTTEHGCQLLTVDCAEWNCEDTTWARFDPAVTRVVHIKGELRRACLGRKPTPPELETLVAVWSSVDRDALRRVRGIA